MTPSDHTTEYDLTLPESEVERVALTVLLFAEDLDTVGGVRDAAKAIAKHVEALNLPPGGGSDD